MKRRRPTDFDGNAIAPDATYLAVMSFAVDGTEGVVRRGDEHAGSDPAVSQHGSRFVPRGRPLPAEDAAVAALGGVAEDTPPPPAPVPDPAEVAAAAAREQRARDEEAEAAARERAREKRLKDPRDANGDRIRAEKTYAAVTALVVEDTRARGGDRHIAPGEQLPGDDPIVRLNGEHWEPAAA